MWKRTRPEGKILAVDLEILIEDQAEPGSGIPPPAAVILRSHSACERAIRGKKLPHFVRPLRFKIEELLRTTPGRRIRPQPGVGSKSTEDVPASLLSSVLNLERPNGRKLGHLLDILKGSTQQSEAKGFNPGRANIARSKGGTFRRS